MKQVVFLFIVFTFVGALTGCSSVTPIIKSPYDFDRDGKADTLSFDRHHQLVVNYGCAAEMKAVLGLCYEAYVTDFNEDGLPDLEVIMPGEKTDAKFRVWYENTGDAWRRVKTEKID